MTADLIHVGDDRANADSPAFEIAQGRTGTAIARQLLVVVRVHAGTGETATMIAESADGSRVAFTLTRVAPEVKKDEPKKDDTKKDEAKNDEAKPEDARKEDPKLFAENNDGKKADEAKPASDQPADGERPQRGRRGGRGGGPGGPKLSGSSLSRGIFGGSFSLIRSQPLC
jgi:hypothetical protein